MKRRHFAILALLLVLLLLIFIQSASNHIVSPKRARLQDPHFAIMAEPAQHGLQLSTHTAPDGTPYLLCRGQRASGKKGRLLRQQLLARGLAPTTQPATLLLLHGHGSRKEHHLAIAERFCAAGFTCLIPDLPGHGEHPSKAGTFGKKEVALLQDFLRHCRLEHGLSPKVGLFGLSQGGAIALQLAAAEREGFTAVATVSTFADLSQTLKANARQKSPLLAALVPMVQLNLEHRHGLPVHEISPAECARQIGLPAFIAHGQKDRFIPPHNAETIYQNLTHANRHLRLVPNAGHGNVLAEGDLIYADLCQFFLAFVEDEVGSVR